MKLRLTNNAETTIAGAINASDTTILLAPGSGTQFPQIVAGEFFPLVLVKTVSGAPVREITYVTALVGDACTVVRGVEGSIAASFSAGDYAGCHATAGCFDGKADLAGAEFTGNLSVDGNLFCNADATFAHNTTHQGSATFAAVANFNGAANFNAPMSLGGQPLNGAALAGCGDKVTTLGAAVDTIDYRNGSYQVWSPAPGTHTLVITNWPAAGINGQLWIEGVNLGACTITTQTALSYLKPDGTYVTTTSLNANQGATLQTSGIDNVLIWGRNGSPQRAKVAR